MPEKSPKGHLRGNPLDIPIKEEANHRSVFGTGVSNGRIVCPARPLLRRVSKSLPFLRGALCCNCCRILTHRGTPKKSYKLSLNFCLAAAAQMIRPFDEQVPIVVLEILFLPTGESLRGNPLRRPFRVFSGEGKDTRRRLDTPKGRFVFPAASRHEQSPSQPTADSPLCTRGPLGLC